MAYPLSVAEISYLDITVDHGKSLLERGGIDQFDSPAWSLNTPADVDLIDLVLPSNEAIMEAMTKIEQPWEDLHHRSYSLLNLNKMQEV